MLYLDVLRAVQFVPFQIKAKGKDKWNRFIFDYVLLDEDNIYYSLNGCKISRSLTSPSASKSQIMKMATILWINFDSLWIFCA